MNSRNSFIVACLSMYFGSSWFTGSISTPPATMRDPSPQVEDAVGAVIATVQGQLEQGSDESGQIEASALTEQLADLVKRTFDDAVIDSYTVHLIDHVPPGSSRFVNWVSKVSLEGLSVAADGFLFGHASVVSTAQGGLRQHAAGANASNSATGAGAGGTGSGSGVGFFSDPAFDPMSLLSVEDDLLPAVGQMRQGRFVMVDLGQLGLTVDANYAFAQAAGLNGSGNDLQPDQTASFSNDPAAGTVQAAPLPAAVWGATMLMVLMGATAIRRRL